MNKLKIENYRSIKKAEFELGGINVLIGDTEAGKSNLFRALRDFAFNTRGENFVTWGEDVTSVDVDGVVWDKGKGKNQYTLSDGTEYKKVGVNCPEEVTQEHGLREVDFGQGVNKRINFSGQHDLHFIINESEQDSAKIVTSILPDINMVLEGSRQAMLKIRKLTGELEKNESDQAEIIEQIEGKENFELIGNKIEKLSKIGDRLNALADQIKIKSKVIQELEAIETAIEEQGQVADSLDKALSQLETQEKGAKRQCLIAQAHANLLEISSDSGQVDRNIGRLSKLGQVAKGIEAKMANLVAIEVAIQAFSGASGATQKVEDKIGEFNGKLESKIVELDKLVDGQEVCPLVKSKFKSGCKELLKGKK